MQRKGRFLHPIIYKFAKSGKKEFLFNGNLNIRSSSYLKRFSKCKFKVHTGKSFYVNDPIFLNIFFKKFPFYNFKLGALAYTRHILNRRGTRGLYFIYEDLRKKKGIAKQKPNKGKKFNKKVKNLSKDQKKKTKK